MNDRTNLNKLKQMHTELTEYEKFFAPEMNGKRELITKQGGGTVSALYNIPDYAIARVDFKPNTVFNPHVHPELEYVIIIEGECVLTVNDIPVPLSKGTVYKIKSNFTHWMQTDETGCSMIVISVPANPQFPKTEK